MNDADLEIVRMRRLAKANNTLARMNRSQADEYRTRCVDLLEALEAFIYETTHLSPERDDGSHDCRISRATLKQGRAAIRKVAK